MTITVIQTNAMSPIAIVASLCQQTAVAMLTKVKHSLIEVRSLAHPHASARERNPWRSRTPGGTALQAPPANRSHAGCIRGICVKEVAEIGYGKILSEDI